MKISKLTTHLFYLLLFSLFWQTRIGFFKNQIVDYLIPFVYLSDFLIIVLLGLVVFTRSPKFWQFVRQPQLRLVHGAFFLFLGLGFLSNLSALHPLSSWYTLTKLPIFYLFALTVAFLVETGQKSRHHKPNVRWEKVFLFLNLGLMLQAVVALGEWITQGSLGLQVLGEWRFSALTPGIAKIVIGTQEFLRPYATFPHPNVLGGVMGIMAAGNLWFLLIRRPPGSLSENNYPRLNLISFLAFSLILFLTFSRSAWLTYAVLVGITFYRFARLKKDFLLLKLKTFTLPIFLGIILVVLLSPLVWTRLESLKSFDQVSVERRWQLNQVSLEMVRKQPFLGLGLNQFIPNLEKYALVLGPGRFLQPVHNVYLLILAEHGILGFLVFAAFLLMALKKLFQPVLSPTPHSSPSTFVPLMFLGILIISFFDHYFWTLQAGQLFFWLSIGLSLGLIDESEKISLQ